ncbi:hypothetical protein [Actinoplanes sp. NPDC026619]|uniref:hypothetical protein n=1 Tax=Actinoplanes sp. NPDC026619 TaxID=3155798 RepID=UPI0033C88BEC
MQPEQPPSPWAAAGTPQYSPPDPTGWPTPTAPPPPGTAGWPAPNGAPGWPAPNGGAGWPPQGAAPWQPGYPPPARPGNHKPLIIGLIAVLVIGLGAGAIGTNAWAKHSICAAMENDTITGSSSAGSSSGGLSQSDLAEMRHVAEQLRGRARLLIFDGTLRTAVKGLADDVDNIANLLGSSSSTEDALLGGGFAELMMVAASVNGHARQAQRACGLPARGIFND